MRKIILPSAIILAIAAAATTVVLAWEHIAPLPQLQETTALSGRVALSLPIGWHPENTPAPEEASAFTIPGGFVEVSESASMASTDFPEPEKAAIQAGCGKETLFQNIGNNLFIVSLPECPGLEIAGLKHTDGSLINITLHTPALAQQRPVYAKRLAQAILTTVKPGPRRLDLNAKEENLSLPEAGVSLSIPVPQGFRSSKKTLNATPSDNNPQPAAPLRYEMLSVVAMAPENGASYILNTFVTNEQPKEPRIAPCATGTLLGQQVQWFAQEEPNGETMLRASIPLGTTGYYLSVFGFCTEKNIPAVIAHAAKIRRD